MRKKLTIDYICSEFKKEGYILLTEKYINNSQKLDYICPKGHKHSISWSNWNHPEKYRRPYCSGKDSTLAVHHIDYNKKFCGAENLITVCRSCNSRANTDRGWHKAWYKAILYKRYGYVYEG